MAAWFLLHRRPARQMVAELVGRRTWLLFNLIECGRLLIAAAAGGRRRSRIGRQRRPQRGRDNRVRSDDSRRCGRFVSHLTCSSTGHVHGGQIKGGLLRNIEVGGRRGHPVLLLMLLLLLMVMVAPIAPAVRTVVAGWTACTAAVAVVFNTASAAVQPRRGCNNRGLVKASCPGCSPLQEQRLLLMQMRPIGMNNPADGRHLLCRRGRSAAVAAA